MTSSWYGWSESHTTKEKPRQKADGEQDITVAQKARIADGDAAQTGWDVADAFRGERPKLPVVYVSANPSSDPRRGKAASF
jgi:hypothetical protein